MEIGWFQRADFGELVKTTWDWHKVNLKDTLELLIKRIVWWKQKVSGSVPKRKRRCLARLSGIQSALCQFSTNYLKILEVINPRI